ncbi:GMP synthase (glutamine-hydrolyzing) [Thelotrema lepadinum]|nr:GMP synthase (glutamine-hydrolyzing) [Thelotrema lepadinum]
MSADAEHVKQSHQLFDTILVLDFGSQTSQLIIRTLRELHILAELLPCTTKAKDLTFVPKGIIFSGGPYSVYEKDAPHADPAIYDLGIPILCICYGMQELAYHLDAQGVVAGEKREYGSTEIRITLNDVKSPLFKDVEGDKITVWASHGDKLSQLPPEFLTIAASANAPFAGIAHNSKPFYAVQFHPEVTHTPQGPTILKNFAVNICGSKQNWTIREFKDQEIERIRALVGPTGQVIGAVSGGVDSSVAAKLMQEAIGDRFHAVLVDNGVLRTDEARIVRKTLDEHLGVNLTVVDASNRFLEELKRVSDPEKKRKIIGRLFIEVFQETAEQISKKAENTPAAGPIDWLLQGTLYPDVIESISYKGPSATIKSHHNVGGLPKDMKLKVIEPLRELYKSEVRILGRSLGIPEDLVMRHPFPGPGLAIRITGPVDAEKLEIARQADSIFIEEIRQAGLYNDISQAYACVFGETFTVGVMGDRRVYGNVVQLRAVQTTDFMTATVFEFSWGFLQRVSTRIVNEVQGVTRVGYDITSKPPATIECE